MKIKEMPTDTKPREKLLFYGVENLSNTDLISIIIRTGTKGENAIDIASHILKNVGSINNLANIGVRELSKINGVGNVKAITILAAIELGKRATSKEIQIKMSLTNSKSVHDSFKRFFKNIKQEKFMAIYLDTKKNLINYKTLFVGTVDHSIVHPREIFNEAIRLSASSLIIIHNHPTGDLTPSKNDIEVTEKIKESGLMLGIPLLDSIITNGEEYYSFNDQNTQE